MPDTKSYALTININGEFLRAIVNGEKKVEYRCLKPYWETRLKGCKAPFLLRFLNGMRPKAPEVIIEVTGVRRTQNANTGLS